jgi:class 3 adenylate cyclase
MPDGADKPAAPRGVISASSQLIERKLATILSADVAEFGRLMSEDEEQLCASFADRRKSLRRCWMALAWRRSI